MGPYEQCAEALVERGYATIPIMRDSKAPGFYGAGMRVPLTRWQERYLHGRQPNYMDHNLWGNGDSGIGVVGGKASHGMVAVDIDTDDTAIKTAIVKVLPATPVKKIGAKGETAFYYGPNITVSRSWNINGKRVCDLIADGRQTVLPPTIHPNTGAPYRWVGDSLDIYDPDELPFLSADTIGNIDAVLIPLGWKPDPSPGKPGNGGASFDADADTPHRDLNNLALARLDCWVPKLGLYKCRPARGGYEAVAHWRESSTGRALQARARNLSIHPTGIKDFGDGRNGGDGFTYTALDLVMAANDCDLDTAFKFLSDHTGWASERVILVDATTVLGSTPTAVETPTEEQPEEQAEEPAKAFKQQADAETPITDSVPAEAKTEAPAPADELDPYTRGVPGVVGEVIEWILATARRPNRVLALAAAIPLVGTLIGRRVAGPTMSATHLYTIAVAPTGACKQHPINCISELLIAAGASNHIGPNRFMSGSALCSFVMRKPLSLCCSDEIGNFLAKVTAKGAPGHEREITSVLRNLWSASFMMAQMPEWATREARNIHTPALSFFGTSTPDELFQALQGESVANGTLNRFLVLNSQLRSRDATPQLAIKPVSPALAAHCHALYRWYGTETEEASINLPIEQEFAQLPWANKTAENEYLDFGRMIDDRIDQNTSWRPFLARTVETAIRLATIRAAGIGYQSATINVGDLYWGAGIALRAGERLYVSMQDTVPVTDRNQLIDRILAYIRAKPRETLNIRDVYKGLWRHARSSKEIKEIVADM